MLQITRVISFFLIFPMKITDTAHYRDATNNRFFICILHIKFIKTARYHDATIDMPDLNFFMLFPMNFAKTAQYHDATNNRRYLIFSVYFPCNSQKQLSRMMIRITHVIYFSHDIFHKSHKNGSVPRCYK